MDEAAHPSAKRGLHRRAGKAIVDRVDRSFSVHGTAFRQLAISYTANFAGDTLVAVGLAGTLFFTVPSSEARANVALYLLLTLAPFVVISPLLPRLFSRVRGGYRLGLAGSAGARVVVALLLAMWLQTVWLFPLAFGILLLSRLHGISKGSLLPVTMDRPDELVEANARLARLGIASGALAVPLGTLAVWLSGPWLSLVLSAGFFAFSTLTALRIPEPPPEPDHPHVHTSSIAVPALGRPFRLSLIATAVVRFLNGFLVLLLAFAFREAEAALAEFGALLAAAGFGFFFASHLAPWLERRLREEPTVVMALAIEAAAAFITAQVFGLVAALVLATAAGVAWGTAKFGFDALLQQTVDRPQRGRVFTGAETLFQIAWVLGAFLPVALPIPIGVGLAAAGSIALAAQVVIVAGLLVSVREGA